MLFKKSIFAILLLGLAVQPVISAEQAVQTERQMQQISLDIQGMSCALCPITIRKKLEKTPGVIEAKVDFDKKMALVKYDATKVNAQGLIDAITSIGYGASLHTAKK